MYMKKKLVNAFVCMVMAILLTTLQGYAKILTVSNNTAISAQYTTLSAAFTAANSGDTVYIHGSNTAYGDITLNKRLVVIGPGYTPTNPTALPATIGTFTLDTLNGVSGTSGTYITGLVMGTLNVSSGYNSHVMNNITLRRNRINSYAYIGSSNTETHNWLIQENLINYLSQNTNNTLSTNILIINNIFNYSYNIYKSIFTNNVIYNVPTFSECTVSNCIFIAAAGNNSSVNNTFNSNLFTSAITFTSGTNTFLPTGQATTNSDPQFAGGTGTSYLSISNYQLQVASAGHNAGTDGKDLGIYGGTGFLWGGSPAVPMIYYYNLKPNYIQANGTLNITISVKNQ